jgi:hypothetical protein
MNSRGKLVKAIRDDANISRFVDFASSQLPKLPKATAKYLAEKAPIVQWIPKYSLSWLWNDLVAGKIVSREFKSELTRDRHHNWDSSSPPESGLC